MTSLFSCRVRALLRGAAAAAVVWISLADAHGQQFLNPSFEVTPSSDGSQLDQGIPPSDWLDVSDIIPGADSYGPGGDFGLAAGDYGHFAGRSGAEGKRWVAGADFLSSQEALGQALTLPGGTAFRWSAALLNSQNFPNNPGGWDLALAKAPSIGDPSVVRVAALPGTAETGAWVVSSVTFTTPANAADYKYVFLIPRSDTAGTTSYVAIDNLSLSRLEETAPVVLGFSPTSALAGETIVVVGTGLESTRAVAVGGQAATFERLPTGELQVVVPEAAVEGPVAVWTAEGKAESADWFRPGVRPEVPVLKSFFPAAGPAGTSVTLSGAGLGAVTEIRLAGVPMEFKLLPGDRLFGVVPTDALTGAFELAHGQGVLKTAEPFEVTVAGTSPVVMGVEPVAGEVGTRVTIRGATFEAVERVTFGGVAAAFQRVDAATLEATVPEGAVTGPVVVTTEAGVAASSQAFGVVTTPPIPAIGEYSDWRTSPGKSVRVRGPGLGRAKEVRVGGVLVPFQPLGSEELAMTIPAGVASGPVGVLTEDGWAESPVPLVVRAPGGADPEPPPLAARFDEGGRLQVEFPVAEHQQYLLESAERLEPGAWEAVGVERPRAQAGLAELSASVTLHPSLFYRVAAAADAGSNWDFEHGLLGWVVTGQAFANQPVYGEAFLRSQAGPPTIRDTVGGDYWDTTVDVGHHGDYWLSSGQEHPEPDSPLLADPRALDVRVGRAVSRRFRLTQPWLSVLLGGRVATGRPGDRSPRIECWVQPTDAAERARWVAEYAEVEAGYFRVWLGAVHERDDELFRRAWADLSQFVGRLAKIAVVDDVEDGHVQVDDIRFLDADPRPSWIEAGGVYRDQDAPVWGFADTHTHPAAHLGFGGRLLAGQAWAPGGAAEALRSCEHAHGVNGANGCAPIFFCAPSILMEQFTGGFGHRTGGYEYGFDGWPTVLEQGVHQQMYIDWIRRAWQGGLRLMVAMAVHNRLLADINFSDNQAKDDVPVAERQLQAIRTMVERNADFMELALDPRRAREIIHRGKLAVVLGIEQDQMFLGRHARDISLDSLRAELDHAYTTLGVRHVFPVHFADNVYGGFAMYNSLWFYNSYWLNAETYPQVVNPAAAGIADPIHWRFEAETGLQVGTFFLGVAAFRAAPGYPAGPHINARALQPAGRMLIRELMRRGVIIDVDHMGVLMKQDVLDMLEAQSYPPISGHSGFSELAWGPGETSERGKLPSEGDLVPSVVARLTRMGGMVSPITLAKDMRAWGEKVANDAPGSAKSYAQVYLYALEKFGGTNLALSTDFGLVHGVGPRFGMKALFPLKHDSVRKGLAREYLARQTNGVRYAEPIRDYREHRFQPPGDGDFYSGEEREYWEAMAMFQAGADPDGGAYPGPRTERIRHVCRGLRARDDGELAVALANLPIIPGDAPHEIRAGYYVRNGLEPRPGDAARVGAIMARLRPIWSKWTDMNGGNVPLRRCTQSCILDADPNRPYVKEWDFNLDGLAHYGLLPDFLQDLKNCGLDRRDLRPLFRSAEDYIRLWERMLRNRYTGP